MREFLAVILSMAVLLNSGVCSERQITQDTEIIYFEKSEGGREIYQWDGAKLHEYDVEKEKAETVVFPKKYTKSVKTCSQIIGYAGDRVWIYLDDYEGKNIGLYCYDLVHKTKDYIKSYREGLSQQAVICFTPSEDGKCIYSTKEEYSPILERYDMETGKTKKIIKQKALLKRAVTDALGTQEAKLMDYRVTRLCLDGTRLYLQASVQWEEKEIIYWQNFIFSIDEDGKEKIRYEKDITEYMLKNGNIGRVRNEDGKRGFINDGSLLEIADGTCLFDMSEDFEIEDSAFDYVFGCYDSKGKTFQKYSLVDQELYAIINQEQLLRRMADWTDVNPVRELAEDYYVASLEYMDRW